MPTIIDLAKQFRDRLLKLDEQAMGRLVSSYQGLYSRLKDKIDLFLLAYGQLEDPTRSQIAKLARYGELIRAIEDELTRYSAYAQVEISNGARLAIEQAIANSAAYLKVYGITAPQTVPAQAIETMLGFLQPDGVMFQRLSRLAGTYAQEIADAILEGVGLGYNPVKVAKLIENSLGMGLTDALRWARTSQLYAYREATRANYIANSDVVQKWVWWAELDGETCASCIAMHGTLHDLDEVLDDHYNGRCAMLPYTGDIPIQETGEDWFNKQDEATQKQIMGDAKYEAWKEGKFEFGQLSSEHTDDVYGLMRGETPLKDLIGE